MLWVNSNGRIAVNDDGAIIDCDKYPCDYNLCFCTQKYQIPGHYLSATRTAYVGVASPPPGSVVKSNLQEAIDYVKGGIVYVGGIVDAGTLDGKNYYLTIRSYDLSARAIIKMNKPSNAHNICFEEVIVEPANDDDVYFDCWFFRSIIQNFNMSLYKKIIFRYLLNSVVQDITMRGGEFCVGDIEYKNNPTGNNICCGTIFRGFRFENPAHETTLGTDLTFSRGFYSFCRFEHCTIDDFVFTDGLVDIYGYENSFLRQYSIFTSDNAHDGGAIEFFLGCPYLKISNVTFGNCGIGHNPDYEDENGNIYVYDGVPGTIGIYNYAYYEGTEETGLHFENITFGNNDFEHNGGGVVFNRGSTYTFFTLHSSKFKNIDFGYTREQDGGGFMNLTGESWNFSNCEFDTIIFGDSLRSVNGNQAYHAQLGNGGGFGNYRLDYDAAQAGTWYTYHGLSFSSCSFKNIIFGNGCDRYTNNTARAGNGGGFSQANSNFCPECSFENITFGKGGVNTAGGLSGWNGAYCGSDEEGKFSFTVTSPTYLQPGNNGSWVPCQ